MGFLSKVLDLLFPPKCVFCGRVLDDADESWCDKCTESLPYTDNLGIQNGEFFDFCTSPLYYTGVVRRSVLNYKFRDASHYADVYGIFLADCIRDCPEVKYEIVTWVPLSTRRERKRGYDQAKLLAEATALRLNDTAVPILRKPHDVQAQSELGDKAEREANIKNAYEIIKPEIVNGKSILLIDDVVTTGSTLEECTKVLLAAGAKKVICTTLARAE